MRLPRGTQVVSEREERAVQRVSRGALQSAAHGLSRVRAATKVFAPSRAHRAEAAHHHQAARAGHDAGGEDAGRRRLGNAEGHDADERPQRLIGVVGDGVDPTQAGHRTDPQVALLRTGAQEEVGPFKLLSVAGAYWKGDQSREQLQRLYATAFFDKKELEEHLARIEKLRIDTLATAPSYASHLARLAEERELDLKLQGLRPVGRVARIRGLNSAAQRRESAMGRLAL